MVKTGPVGFGGLAAALHLDGSTLTRNLQPLVERGWVEVVGDEADARGHVALATPAGQAWPGETQQARKNRRS